MGLRSISSRRTCCRETSSTVTVFMIRAWQGIGADVGCDCDFALAAVQIGDVHIRTAKTIELRTECRRREPYRLLVSSTPSPHSPTLPIFAEK